MRFSRKELIPNKVLAMNINKLLKKAESFLNADERKRKEKRKYLKHVLKKLKKYERALREKLENELDDTSRTEIEREVALAHAQRKKGLKNLEALKRTSKSKGGH